jgi:hypothetical protein
MLTLLILNLDSLSKNDVCGLHALEVIWHYYFLDDDSVCVLPNYCHHTYNCTQEGLMNEVNDMTYNTVIIDYWLPSRKKSIW